MEKVILVDGNNLMFRSYYATAYTGSVMRNKEGFPTNALYGFVNMMNKIISEENPKYIAVAFDVGKTFRHNNYEGYKGGRDETPDDLKRQFPVAKEILTLMGIKYIECPGYEADDIIGTLSKMVNENDDFVATIVSSDKDLLQLISSDVEVKLLKQKDYIRMNRDTFFETYGIEPIRMIDLKSLMGDPSDNIPGVKGIGEKTALKLLQEYETLENVYNHMDEIKGATKVKLEEGLDSANMSKELATIYTEAPIDVDFNDILYKEKEIDKLIELYNKLEFYSFIKKEQTPTKKEEEIKVQVLTDISNLKIEGEIGLYIELDNENYHNANILGISIYNDKISAYIPYEVLNNNPDFLKDINILTYDIKRLYVSLSKNNILIGNLNYDAMIAGYLLNYNIKEDIAYLAHSLGVELNFYDAKEKVEEQEFITRSVKKAKFIYDTKQKIIDNMNKEEVFNLYEKIELPLSFVLAKMELEGIRVDKQVLYDMKEELNERIDLVSKEVYTLASEEFNISSPKQLGSILFEKLQLPNGKKNKNGNYQTDEQSLKKIGSYPIIEKILEYRMLTKLLTTYVDGILNTISPDDKIHTIYTQTLTRTGRLSSIEPNLQNIPVRNEYGRRIRKAFIPEEQSLIMSSDYSQIELRVFAHMSQVKDLVDAFNQNKDIHTKTAMDIFNVSEENVTKDMRRHAKAVNFGILYGISSYGLAEDLLISNKEAKEFINKYFETYPGIKDYMNEVIKEAHNIGYVKTIMNRKRVIEELHNSNYMIRSMGERMALNTPIQGSSADILKKSMIEIQNELDKRNYKSKMFLQVHDELIFNVYKEEKENVEQLVKEIMENTYKLTVPLVVDIEYGTNWYEAK